MSIRRFNIEQVDWYQHPEIEKGEADQNQVLRGADEVWYDLVDESSGN